MSNKEEKTIIDKVKFLCKNLTHRISRLGRVPRAMLYLVRLLAETFREFNKDACAQMSSSMAYKTILSLVPLIAIFLCVAAAHPVFEEKREEGLTFVSEILVPVSSNSDVESKQNLLKVQRDVRETVETFASRANQVGALGLLALFAIAASLMASTEKSYNFIWGVQQNRPFFTRMAYYLCTIILIPALFVASTALTAQFQGMYNTVVGGNSVWLLKYISYLPAFGLTFLSFIVLNRYVPYTRVTWVAAAGASFLCAVAWEVLKGFVVWYLTYVVSYAKVYGSLAAVPILLFVIYLLWVVVLFSAELAYTIQNFSNLRDKAALEESETRLRSYIAARVMMFVAREFRLGNEAYNIEIVAEKLKLPGVAVRLIVGDLVKAHLLQRLEDSTVPTYQPACCLTVLTLRDVVAAVAPRSFDVAAEPLDADRNVLAPLFEAYEKKEHEILDISFDELLTKCSENELSNDE